MSRIPNAFKNGTAFIGFLTAEVLAWLRTAAATTKTLLLKKWVCGVAQVRIREGTARIIVIYDHVFGLVRSI